MKRIGERIRLIRKNLGMNQMEFAKSLAISRAHIANVENGNDALSNSVIQLICLKHSIDEKWLLTGRGSMFTPEREQAKALAFVSGEITQIRDILEVLENKIVFMRTTLDSLSNLPKIKEAAATANSNRPEIRASDEKESLPEGGGNDD